MQWSGTRRQPAQRALRGPPRSRRGIHGLVARHASRRRGDGVRGRRARARARAIRSDRSRARAAPPGQGCATLVRAAGLARRRRRPCAPPPSSPCAAPSTTPRACRCGRWASARRWILPRAGLAAAAALATLAALPAAGCAGARASDVERGRNSTAVRARGELAGRRRRGSTPPPRSAPRASAWPPRPPSRRPCRRACSRAAWAAGRAPGSSRRSRPRVTDTSAMCCAERGTSSVEPDFTSMRAGMWLTSRSSASLMPTSLGGVGRAHGLAHRRRPSTWPARRRAT